MSGALTAGAAVGAAATPVDAGGRVGGCVDVDTGPAGVADVQAASSATPHSFQKSPAACGS
jgi:hypothetical protein